MTLQNGYKKVLLVVIDALASRVVMPAMRQGRLPCLAELSRRGTTRDRCISIFPSITPAATASIVTGVYPIDHGISGSFWFDRKHDDVAYHGDDFWVVANKGINEFFHDFLVDLNFTRLEADTLYQYAERNDRVAAAINFMWFRGDHPHPVNPPVLMRALPGISRVTEVHGPQVLALADFTRSEIPGCEEPWTATGGVARRFGFHDDTTGEFLLELAKADPFPDLTVAYFPNNDYVSHDEGPHPAEHALANVDEHLQRFIQARGGIDYFLDEFAVLIVGDHAQTDMVGPENNQGINMTELFSDFRVAKAGAAPSDEDDLVVCPNMRACHVYCDDREPGQRTRVIRTLLADLRIDQVIFREGAWGQGCNEAGSDVRSKCFHVLTADRGRLVFHAVDDEINALTDDYGNHWRCEGELTAVGATLKDGRLIQDEYPNALERIATGFSQQADELWVTAKPGYEFQLNETAIHAGGSHGALNRDDALTVLITGGVPEDVEIPQVPRTIDVAPLALRILGCHEKAEHLVRNRQAGAVTIGQYSSRH